MSKIRLFGTSSGYVEIAPAAAASNNTLTAPSTVGEIIAKDAAGAIGITSVKASNVNVGAAVTITESGIEASGIGITCASINGGQISGRRNLVINGAMNIAQRGNSSTTSGYTTVDRWNNSYSADASITFTQHALTSSDSGPYEEGLRYSNHAANGDTAAGGTQSLNWQQPIEAQNVSLSGWNYTSSSSFITLSFWAKSSVGQTFNMSVMTTDGTIKNFPFDVTLAANTWTKVIKTIPGNSGLQIDNDNGEGFRININVFTGTTYTSNSVTNDTWQNWASGSRFRDNTSTWFTTNGATFEYTGVQLEVGSQATSFEHLSFGEELALCQRYYEHSYNYGTYPGASTTDGTVMFLSNRNSGTPHTMLRYAVPKRSAPTVTAYTYQGNAGMANLDAGVDYSSYTFNRNGQMGCTAYPTGTPVIGQFIQFHYTASSEL